MTFTVFQGKKTTYQQVRDTRILSPGARTIVFIVPTDKLPTEGGKVHVRAELSKPATKPSFREIVYDLNNQPSFRLIEPLRYLFKDEVRQAGLALGLPEDVVWRQPFPGPGLAIRVIGEVTRERLETLRAADWVVIDEIKRSGLYRKVWQSFAILTPISSVGVMGDGRTYGNVVAVRIVESEDGMTADWARVPYDVLAIISRRIVNEVPAVNRVVFDISSKPPSTIEWE